MQRLPDLTDPRYLDEVGWFLYHEKYRRDCFGGSYTQERLAYSQILLREVLEYLGRDPTWLENQTVVSVGCGCTGDLASWPASVKIAIDPLLYVYQKLGMVIEDAVGACRTVYLSIGAEDLPLLDDSADLVYCRNALDHIMNPDAALREMWRILRIDGALFLSIDIGGVPTPDEPTVFSVESLTALLQENFEVQKLTDGRPPHSVGRVCSVRLLARKKPRVSIPLDKEEILKAYKARLGMDQGGESK